MMQFEGIDITAPAMFPHDSWNRAETLGAITWLWLRTSPYREVPLSELDKYVLPVLDNGQFALFTEQGRVFGYLSWAAFNQETEAQYLQSDNVLHISANWQSGNRIWLIDWFAPFGDSLRMKTLARRYLFPRSQAHSLYHKTQHGKPKIMRFTGE